MSIWFCLEEAHAHIANPSNQISGDYENLPLPKLFTVHCKGAGGLELFFIGRKLYCRNLSTSYDNPSPISNASFLWEFNVKTWYYLGLEFDKPKMFGKSQLHVLLSFLKSITYTTPILKGYC